MQIFLWRCPPPGDIYSINHNNKQMKICLPPLYTLYSVLVSKWVGYKIFCKPYLWAKASNFILVKLKGPDLIRSRLVLGLSCTCAAYTLQPVVHSSSKLLTSPSVACNCCLAQDGKWGNIQPNSKRNDAMQVIDYLCVSSNSYLKRGKM